MEGILHTATALKHYPITDTVIYHYVHSHLPLRRRLVNVVLRDCVTDRLLASCRVPTLEVCSADYLLGRPWVRKSPHHHRSDANRASSLAASFFEIMRTVPLRVTFIRRCLSSSLGSASPSGAW